MEEVPLHLSAPTLEIMKGPKRGLKNFFFLISECPVSPMSAQHLLSLPTSRVVDLERPLREQKKGNHKEGSCFQ